MTHIPPAPNKPRRPNRPLKQMKAIIYSLRVGDWVLATYEHEPYGTFYFEGPVSFTPDGRALRVGNFPLTQGFNRVPHKELRNIAKSDQQTKPILSETKLTQILSSLQTGNYVRAMFCKHPYKTFFVEGLVGFAPDNQTLRVGSWYLTKGTQGNPNPELHHIEIVSLRDPSAPQTLFISGAYGNGMPVDEEDELILADEELAAQ
jgi:hypothetical protein